jgi:hypothetical protein
MGYAKLLRKYLESAYAYYQLEIGAYLSTFLHLSSIVSLNKFKLGVRNEV